MEATRETPVRKANRQFYRDPVLAQCALCLGTTHEQARNAIDRTWEVPS
jgi:hypothetical protein